MPDRPASDPCAAAPPAALYTGIAEFNRGAYFECHETLEAIWMREPHPIRRLYQGILQVGIGFYHLGHGNYRGTLNLLGSAQGYLAPFAPRCLGVDVARLQADAAQVRAAVVALGPERIAAFDLTTLPPVHYNPAVAALAVPETPGPPAPPEELPGHW